MDWNMDDAKFLKLAIEQAKQSVDEGGFSLGSIMNPQL
jgi:hypothetical protein